MLSRSSTSSPDILGPTGDSDYLLSSPVKPFRGRQTAMSPSNLQVLQTPGTVKGKAPRFSLSPSKSAHSIRFDDVLLPVSPHMKLNAAQGPLSLDKGQLDGNQSPWRIRVTLEATQDEEEAPGSPARKRARQSTMTTKVPLKDESEQTPRRRRGRPRKSDVIEPSATPTPAPATGSPGHTPGPAGHTPGPAGTPGQKRKRGRPRKSQLQIEAPEPETNGQVQDDQGEDAGAQNEEADIQEIEPPAEEPTPVAEPTRSWSPLDIAADNDDDFDDELPDAPDPFDFVGHTERPDEANPPRSSPRVTFATPNVDTIDDAYLRIGEPNLDSTPSKMPSPPREDHGSPENALHAGRTPMPPRRYPTPNSSSQMGDERHDRPGAATTVLGNSDRENGLPRSVDPTDEHREFDSIMESEGFSMVSLDTLPSAKQHGLSASASSDLKAKKGSLKPFLDKEITTSSKRNPRFTRDETNDDENAQGYSSAVIERQQSHLRTHSNASNPSVVYPSLDSQHSSREVQSPPTAATAAPIPPPVPIKQRPLAKLVKLVRAGIALGDVLFNSYEFPPVADLYAYQGKDPDLEAPIRRLERLFGDFNPEILRQLHVALGFAHEFTRLRILDEIDGEIEAQEAIPSTVFKTRQLHVADESATSPEPGDMDRTPHETPSSEMKRRMEEWQRERDAISREIRLANSSQVIVLDSDGSGRPTPDNRANYYDDGHYEEGHHEDEHYEGHYEERFDSDQDSVSELEQPLEPEEPQTDVPADDIDAEEEDGYEDIWQQEAHDLGSPSDHPSIGDDYRNGDQYGQESSPWKGTDRGKSSPASWTNEHDKVPFLGPSRVSQLREQEVDLSGILRAQPTPNRSRYYYGKSSPFSTASGRSPERSPENYQTTEPRIEEAEVEEEDENEGEEYEEQEVMGEPEYQVEQDFRSENYLETSPRRSSEDDTFQIDPTTRFENSLQQPDSPAGESEDGSIEYDAQSEQPSAQQTLDITPQRPQAENTDAPPSSWFQRIASLTPGWLKAPNRKKFEQSEPSVEGDTDYGYDEPIPSKEPSYTEEDTPKPVENGEWEETPRPPRQSTTSTRDQRSSFQPSSGQRSRGTRLSSDAKTNDQTYDRPPPLSVSGYFSDEHYYLLRRLYRAAIKFPERFPYYPAPGRSDIIGDWIWTSDGTYGVPITERQFAIIDRFVQDLAKTDIQAGGTGQVSWTEADLHRRLISIIIGEQIRAETKEQQQQAESSKAEAETSTLRGLTSRLWR